MSPQGALLNMRVVKKRKCTQNHEFFGKTYVPKAVNSIRLSASLQLVQATLLCCTDFEEETFAIAVIKSVKPT